MRSREGLLQDQALEAVALGRSLGTWCRESGVPRRDVLLWQRRSPEFREGLEQARATRREEIEDVSIERHVTPLLDTDVGDLEGPEEIKLFSDRSKAAGEARKVVESATGASRKSAASPGVVAGVVNVHYERTPKELSEASEDYKMVVGPDGVVRGRDG